MSLDSVIRDNENGEGGGGGDGGGDGDERGARGATSDEVGGARMDRAAEDDSEAVSTRAVALKSSFSKTGT